MHKFACCWQVYTRIKSNPLTISLLSHLLYIHYIIYLNAHSSPPLLLPLLSLYFTYIYTSCSSTARTEKIKPHLTLADYRCHVQTAMYSSLFSTLSFTSPPSSNSPSSSFRFLSREGVWQGKFTIKRGDCR